MADPASGFACGVQSAEASGILARRPPVPLRFSRPWPPMKLLTPTPALAPAASRPSAAERWACGLGAILWLAAAAWLLVGASGPGLWLGAGWLLLAAAWPAGYFYTLAPALAFFGNNPGGPHLLYLLELALIGLVARHLAERALGRVERRRSRLDAWVWLLVVWSWLTLLPQARWLWVELYHTRGDFLYAIANHYVTAPTYGLQCALKLTLAAGLYAHLRDRPWDAGRIARWLKLALAVLAVTALAGLGNYLGVVPLEWWRGENAEIARFGFPRLQSLYWHSGWYAQYVVALAPAALVVGWLGRGRRRLAWWALAALLVPVVLLTMQRAGWLALVAGYGAVAAAWVAQGGRRCWMRLGLALGALVLSALLVATLNETFRSRAAELFMFRHRTELWQGALTMIRSQPLAGVGLGNYYTTHMRLFSGDHPLAALQYKGTAHSLYLQLWSERGIIGLVLGVGVLAGALVLLGRLAARGREADTRAIALALAGGLLALAVNGLFQYVFYVRTIELLAWLMIGWAAGLAGPAAPPQGRRAIWLWLALPLALGSLIYENFAYLQPWRIWFEDDMFYVTAEEARIPLPAGAGRVRLRLASIDPDNQRDPVGFEVLLEGRLLAELRFEAQAQREVVLDLPVPASAGAELVVRASRSWSPFSFGMRSLPLNRVGVLYRDPVALE